MSTPDRAEETSPGGQSSAETFASLLMTPKPITELISGEKGASSVIKYKVTTTPGYVEKKKMSCLVRNVILTRHDQIKQ